MNASYHLRTEHDETTTTDETRKAAGILPAQCASSPISDDGTLSSGLACPVITVTPSSRAPVLSKAFGLQASEREPIHE